MQFGISLQAMSAFIVGLFAPSKMWDIHPWVLAAGAWVGIIVDFVVQFGYLKVVSDPRPINPGMLGFACQLGPLLVFECGRRVIVGKKSMYSASQQTATEDETEKHLA